MAVISMSRFAAWLTGAANFFNDMGQSIKNAFTHLRDNPGGLPIPTGEASSIPKGEVGAIPKGAASSMPLPEAMPTLDQFVSEHAIPNPTSMDFSKEVESRMAQQAVKDAFVRMGAVISTNQHPGEYISLTKGKTPAFTADVLGKSEPEVIEERRVAQLPLKSQPNVSVKYAAGPQLVVEPRSALPLPPKLVTERGGRAKKDMLKQQAALNDLHDRYERYLLGEKPVEDRDEFNRKTVPQDPELDVRPGFPKRDRVKRTSEFLRMRAQPALASPPVLAATPAMPLVPDHHQFGVLQDVLRSFPASLRLPSTPPSLNEILPHPGANVLIQVDSTSSSAASMPTTTSASAGASAAPMGSQSRHSVAFKVKAKPPVNAFKIKFATGPVNKVL